MSNKVINSIVIFVAAILALSFFICTKSALMDDAFIFYTYAKNIVAGHGYVFNVGEYVNGTTSALYTLGLAFFGTLLKGIVKLPEIGRAISALGLFAICYYVGRIQHKDKSALIGLFFTLALFGNRMLLGAVGMETFLTLALQMAALHYFLEKRYAVFSVLSSLAMLSRPDAVLFVIVLFGYYIYKERRLPEFKYFVLFSLPLVMWYGFSYFYFGAFLPNTFGAKMAQTASGRWGSGFIFLSGLLKSTARSYGPYSVWILSLVLLVNLIFVRRLCKNKLYLILSLWALIYLIVYGVILNPPSYPWYNTPMALVLALWIAAPFSLLRTGHTRNFLFSLLACLLFCADLRLMRLQLNLAVPNKYEIYRRAAKWINQSAESGVTVAANEIGVIGYYIKNARVIDALGLVTKGANQYIRQQNYAWYIEQYKPDLILLNNPPRKTLENYAYQPWFKEQYTLTNIIRSPRHNSAVQVYTRKP